MFPPRVEPGSTVPDTTVGGAVFGPGPRGDRPALIDATSGRVVSYAELTRTVGAAAAGLADAGLGRGAVVGVYVPDSPEFAVAAHAVLAAGAVLTPIPATASAAELAQRLTETGARALITWPVLLDLALEAVKQTSVGRVFCFGDEPDAERFRGLLTGGRRLNPAIPGEGVSPRTDPAVLGYTRGTTGPAKGVRLTHRSMVAGLLQLAGAGVLSGSDRLLSGIPFAEMLGLNGVLNPALQLGATVVTRSGAGRHDLLRALQDHRVTVALLPPAMVEMLAFDRAVHRYHLTSLRAVLSTGGPLAPETARACAVRLRCQVRQAYGLTEAAGLTHLSLRPKEEGTLDSVGRGLQWTEWRIVDPATGVVQSAYQAGELCLRGPMVADAHLAGAGGGVVRMPPWLRTGDVAFGDEHGRVFIMGRIGEAPPEPPTEPQDVLAAHPAVADAVVVPVPDPEIGLVSHGFVVLTDAVSTEELLSYVNSHVPPYLHIVAVHSVDLIPRSATGRVKRRALLERAGLSF